MLLVSGGDGCGFIDRYFFHCVSLAVVLPERLRIENYWLNTTRPRMPAGLYRLVPSAGAQCQTDAENQYLAPLKNSPYADLLNLKQAKRAEIASRLQRGQITIEQANVELATMTSQITGEATNRTMTAASVSAQQSAAAAQGQAAAAASMSAMQATMPRPPVTCMRTGNMVTCN